MYTDGYVCDNNKFGIDLVDEDAIKFISEITGKKYSHYEENDKQDRFRIIFSDKNVNYKSDLFAVETYTGTYDSTISGKL